MSEALEVKVLVGRIRTAISNIPQSIDSDWHGEWVYRARIAFLRFTRLGSTKSIAGWAKIKRGEIVRSCQRILSGAEHANLGQTVEYLKVVKEVINFYDSKECKLEFDFLTALVLAYSLSLVDDKELNYLNLLEVLDELSVAQTALPLLAKNATTAYMQNASVYHSHRAPNPMVFGSGVEFNWAEADASDILLKKQEDDRRALRILLVQYVRLQDTEPEALADITSRLTKEQIDAHQWLLPSYISDHLGVQSDRFLQGHPFEQVYHATLARSCFTELLEDATAARNKEIERERELKQQEEIRKKTLQEIAAIRAREEEQARKLVNRLRRLSKAFSEWVKKLF